MIESEDPGPLRSVSRPQPLGSLVAAAQRLTGKTVRSRTASAQEWQADAWQMYNLVGEQRFLATTLAGRLSQARLYVGRLGDDPAERPEPVTDGPAADVFAAFGGSPSHRAQLIARLGINLFVAGDGFLAGIPRQLLAEVAEKAAPTTGNRGGFGLDAIREPDRLPPDGNPAELDLDDLEWRMLSVSEIHFDAQAGQVRLDLGESPEERITCSPDEIVLIRCWRPHPQHWWLADSPTRSSLPVLRELVGLTMHISAQVDSRLAGAGVLLVPQSAAEAIKRGMGDDAGDDPFADALMEAMITPIEDRSNASALVPLVVTVPDETTGLFNLLTFANSLDPQARDLRDEAIRRLALGQDAPPEILLGVGGMNHWGAWLVREDTISTHIEPPLALICDALTSQFLHPMLAEANVADPDRYVIWYDVSHLVMRPNRTQDAQNLHAAGVITDTAYRDAAGFGENDAPVKPLQDPAIDLAVDLVKTSPTLLQVPGLPAVVNQVREVLASVGAAETGNNGEGQAPRQRNTPRVDGGEPVNEPGENDGVSQGEPISPGGSPGAVTSSAEVDHDTAQFREYQEWLARHDVPRQVDLGTVDLEPEKVSIEHEGK